jgi:hypothetical protein
MSLAGTPSRRQEEWQVTELAQWLLLRLPAVSDRPALQEHVGSREVWATRPRRTETIERRQPWNYDIASLPPPEPQVTDVLVLRNVAFPD